MYGPPRRGGGHHSGGHHPRPPQRGGRFSRQPNYCISPQFCARYHGHIEFYQKVLDILAGFGIFSTQELEHACSHGLPSGETEYLFRNMSKWVHAEIVSENWASVNGWDGTGGSHDQYGGGPGGGHGMGSGSRHGGPSGSHSMSNRGRHGGLGGGHGMSNGRYPGGIRGGPGMGGGRPRGGMGAGRCRGGLSGRHHEVDRYYETGSDGDGYSTVSGSEDSY